MEEISSALGARAVGPKINDLFDPSDPTSDPIEPPGDLENDGRRLGRGRRVGGHGRGTSDGRRAIARGWGRLDPKGPPARTQGTRWVSTARGPGSSGFK